MSFIVSFQRTAGILLILAMLCMTALTSNLFCGTEQEAPVYDDRGAQKNTVVTLTISEIHNIAWPAARSYYNAKIVQETRKDPSHIEPLSEKAYLQPTAIFFRGQGLEVLYGGNKAGPVIRVDLNESGSISKVAASRASK